MKKILLLVSSVMLSASVFAAGVGGNLNSAVGQPGSTTKIAATTGGDLQCAALSGDADTTPVKVGLSKENIGAVDCSGTDIGVAVASTKGKGLVFSVGSGGGSEQQTSCASAALCAQSDATTQAAAALALASS